MFFKTSTVALSSLSATMLASFSKKALSSKNSTMSRRIAKELGRRLAENELGITTEQSISASNLPDYVKKILTKIEHKHPNSFASGKREVYSSAISTSELVGAAYTPGEYADYHDETTAPTFTPS